MYTYTEGETHLQRARIVYGGGDSSTEGEARLQRLVYKGGDLSTKGETSTEGETRHGEGDSSMEGEACLQRGKLVYRGEDWSMVWKTHIRRGRLVYGGGGSYTEGETRLQRKDSSTEGQTCLWRGRLVYR
jgi:hypothetical protein